MYDQQQVMILMTNYNLFMSLQKCGTKIVNNQF